MKSATDEQIRAVVARIHKKWDRTLVVVGIPHAAAFGAWISRYQLNDHIYESFIAFSIFLPITCVWLGLLYSQLENSFLRNSASRKLKLIAENLKFFAFMGYPVLLGLAVDYFRSWLDTQTLLFVVGTLMSWLLCAIWVSSSLQNQIMNELGIHPNE